jgi:hypothetical protein
MATMASIIKRGPYQYQATVRRRGYKTQCKTFESRADAEAWAQAIESSMHRGKFRDPSGIKQITLEQAHRLYEPKSKDRCTTPPKRSFLSLPSLRCLFFEQYARCLPRLARLGRGFGGLFARFCSHAGALAPCVCRRMSFRWARAPTIRLCCKVLATPTFTPNSYGLRPAAADALDLRGMPRVEPGTILAGLALAALRHDLLCLGQRLSQGRRTIPCHQRRRGSNAARTCRRGRPGPQREH